MTEVIEKIRVAKENEFFFREHDNIGMCQEFERLIKYINQHSNISIERAKIESIEQIQMGRSYSGGSFNFKVLAEHDEEEISF